MRRIQAEPIPQLDEPYLAEFLGGPIRVRIEDTGELTSEEGIYKIDLALQADQNSGALPDIKTMGFVKLDTPAKSLFERLSNRFLAIWHREFG